ncbi:MAG TPA: DUF2891 domain-containing protein [Thermomicrobiaceae bacterium]|nr:DUF2891 domain-containing protein [Thermomicrobiaceae bacterium]
MISVHERAELLHDRAPAYARVALDNIRREHPSYVVYVSTGAGVPPAPRRLHPAFYGSFDWHSCVEMHWVLARLLRLLPDLLPRAEIRAALEEHLTGEAIAGEVAYFSEPAQHTVERPYGWGWLLMLVHELRGWDDPDARRWDAALDPLATLFAGRLQAWLPRLTYPVRYGAHYNSAFGLSLALPYARDRAASGDRALLEAIVDAARRWFGEDAGYPAAWEPSGGDFLSPALVEAELMSRLMEPQAFTGWLDRFLPDIAAGEPRSLFTPVTVADPTDGHSGHLHGLNLSRAWCWRRLAERLPAGDARVGVMLDAGARHAAASLPHVVGGDYTLEHWLACYAVLLLS